MMSDMNNANQLPPGMVNQMPPGMNEQVQQDVQQEMMMKLVKNAKPVLCKCGCNVFKEGIQVVRASAMDPNNTSGHDQMIHIPVLYCVKCNNSIDIK